MSQQWILLFTCVAEYGCVEYELDSHVGNIFKVLLGCVVFLLCTIPCTVLHKERVTRHFFSSCARFRILFVREKNPAREQEGGRAQFCTQSARLEIGEHDTNRLNETIRNYNKRNPLEQWATMIEAHFSPHTTHIFLCRRRKHVVKWLCRRRR